MWRILSNVFATQDVRLTGQYEDMHPGVCPAFLREKVMTICQVWGDFPVKKLGLKISSNSCLALGPRASRNVGGISSGPGAHLARIWRMVSSSSSFRKAVQQLSPAVGDFSVDFSCRMLFPSPLLKRRQLTAVYSFMKAVALPWLVVKVPCVAGAPRIFFSRFAGELPSR